MLAEGISSRTTLSSFENRKTNLSSQTLFDYLNKMNITVHEFSLLLDSEATDQNDNSYKTSILVIMTEHSPLIT